MLTFRIAIRGDHPDAYQLFFRKIYQVAFFSEDLTSASIYLCLVAGPRLPPTRHAEDPAAFNVTVQASVESPNMGGPACESIVATDRLWVYRDDVKPWQEMWGEGSHVDPAIPLNARKYADGLEIQDAVLRDVYGYDGKVPNAGVDTRLGFRKFKPGDPPDATTRTFLDHCVDARAILLFEPDAQLEPPESFCICLPEAARNAISAVPVPGNATLQYNFGADETHYSNMPGVDIISWRKIQFSGLKWPSAHRDFRIEWVFPDRYRIGRKSRYIFHDAKFYVVAPLHWSLDHDASYTYRSSKHSAGKENQRPNALDRMIYRPEAYFNEWREDHRIGLSTVFRLRGRALESPDAVRFTSVAFESRLTRGDHARKDYVVGLLASALLAFGLDATRLNNALKHAHSVATQLQTPECASSWGIGKLTCGAFADFPYFGAHVGPTAAWLVATLLTSFMFILSAGRDSSFEIREVKSGSLRPFFRLITYWFAVIFYALWCLGVIVLSDYAMEIPKDMAMPRDASATWFRHLSGNGALLWWIATTMSIAYISIVVFASRAAYPIGGLREFVVEKARTSRMICIAAARKVYNYACSLVGGVKD